MAQATRRATVVIVLALTLLATSIRASSTNDFYLSVLHRGMAHADAGNDLAAVKELRIAAFGLVENVVQFELAEAYLAVVAHRLKREQEARHSLQRLVAAERVEQHYPTLPLPNEVRTAIETIAPSLLTPEQAAILRGGGLPAQTLPNPKLAAPAAQPATPVPQPLTPTRQPVTPVPRPANAKPKPEPDRVVPPAPPKPGPEIGVTPPPKPSEPAATHATDRTETHSAAPQEEKRIDAARRIEEPREAATTHKTLPPASATAMPADAQRRLADADGALNRGDLAAARAKYAALVGVNPLDRGSALRIAEGLYETGEFHSAVLVYQRVGGFLEGESRQRYYFAVSLYETGEYRAAKRELAAALPKLERTPEVERNRAKIEGAIE